MIQFYVMAKYRLLSLEELQELEKEFIDYLVGIEKAHGRLSCLNFLTTTQGLSLPDAVFFFDIFVRMK